MTAAMHFPLFATTTPNGAVRLRAAAGLREQNQGTGRDRGLGRRAYSKRNRLNPPLNRLPVWFFINLFKHID